MEQTSAPPGWYEAGVPGRLRWWDGSRWTEHECLVPDPRPASPPQAQQPESTAIPMGWYAVPGTAETRWWDGRYWTAYRVVDGVPRTSWYDVDPPRLGYIFGSLFLALGLVQLLLSLMVPRNFFQALIFLVIGGYWMGAAIMLASVRAKPAPDTTPVAVGQPLPGVSEGPGARWVPLTSRVGRWWTGAQWAPYVLMSGRVRPTHSGPKTYRGLKITAGVLFAAGVLGAVLGALLLAVEEPSIGIGLLVGGIVVAIIGGPLLLVLAYASRHALLLPESPPEN